MLRGYGGVKRDCCGQARGVGGKITEMGRLPDGSGFARMSMPLRKDHRIYDGDRKESYGVFNVPPMPFLGGSRSGCGTPSPSQITESTPANM